MKYFKIITAQLFPTAEQLDLIYKTLHAKIFVYNHYRLQLMKCVEEDSKFPFISEFTKDLTKLRYTEMGKRHFLDIADRTALNEAIKDLREGFEFKRFAKTYGMNYYQIGWPKEKPYDELPISYRSSITSYGRVSKRTGRPNTPSIEFAGNMIKYPKLGWVKCVWTRRNYPESILVPADWRIYLADVKLTRTRKLYGSIHIEFDDHQPVWPVLVNPREIAIDIGIKTFATLSNGQKYDYEDMYGKNFFKRAHEHIDKHLEKLKGKAPGSANYEKERIILSQIQEDLTNKRRNFIYWFISKLISEYDIFYVEGFKVTEALKHNKKNIHDINRAYYDRAIYTFFEELKHQAAINNKLVITIDKTFPSSKLCSNCGYLYDELDSIQIGYERSWICPQCGKLHDRDINAAINIFRRGQFKVIHGYYNPIESYDDPDDLD